MANQEHLDILLKQGVKVWNQWRKEYPDIQPNLNFADLSGAELSKAQLSRIICEHANLSGTNLCRANLHSANLIGADFEGSILNAAILKNANLSGANLYRSDLFTALLDGANFSWTNLSETDLRESRLFQVNFNKANLNGANLSKANMGSTNFGGVDLSVVRGLDTVEHWNSSTIGIDTIYRSGGNIPESFLRGAGIDDTFITYMRSLVGNPIEYYTCFISYSSKDQAFAERLYADLQNNNVRCWYAPEDLKIGDHYHQRIDESIRLYDKLVLILSEHALQSAWVEREVVAAREKEDREKRQVLFPLRLDETVMETTKAWAADVRRRWHTGDFTRWKEHDEYQKGLSRLLRDLKQDAATENAQLNLAKEQADVY